MQHKYGNHNIIDFITQRSSEKVSDDLTRRNLIMRNVKQIYRATSQHWVGDGFLVQPLFSHMADDRGTNPFLMLDYAAPYEFSPQRSPQPARCRATPAQRL